MTNLEMVRKLYPKFNWAAKDENGRTWIYVDKPRVGACKWVPRQDKKLYSFQEWLGIDLHLADNWKESLTELHEIETLFMIQEWITSLKWIATDSRGETHMYEYKPELINGEWMPGSVAGLVMSINFHYYSDGYKKSLRKLELE